MTMLFEDVYIDASPAHVWNVIADLGGVVNYHPSVTASYYTSEAHTGTGASRVCEFGGEFTIEETAVEWEEGESYTLSIAFVDGPKPPIDDIQGMLTVRPEKGGTRVGMRMTYKPRLGPVGALMDRVMIRPRYEKMLPTIMVGLKHYIEQGEPVDGRLLKQLQQAVA